MSTLTNPIDRVQHLRSHDGVVVHVLPDRTNEYHLMLSRPGLVSDPECFDGASRFWQDVLPHPVFEGVQCILLIDPATAQLSLLDRWHRAALTPEQRTALLEDHAQRHRTWVGLLAEENAQAAQEAGDGEEGEEDSDDDGRDATDAATMPPLPPSALRA